MTHFDRDSKVAVRVLASFVFAFPFVAGVVAETIVRMTGWGWPRAAGLVTTSSALIWPGAILSVPAVIAYAFGVRRLLREGRLSFTDYLHLLGLAAWPSATFVVAAFVLAPQVPEDQVNRLLVLQGVLLTLSLIGIVRGVVRLRIQSETAQLIMIPLLYLYTMQNFFTCYALVRSTS